MEQLQDKQCTWSPGVIEFWNLHAPTVLESHRIQSTVQSLSRNCSCQSSRQAAKNRAREAHDEHELSRHGTQATFLWLISSRDSPPTKRGWTEIGQSWKSNMLHNMLLIGSLGRSYYSCFHIVSRVLGFCLLECFYYIYKAASLLRSHIQADDLASQRRGQRRGRLCRRLEVDGDLKDWLRQLIWNDLNIPRINEWMNERMNEWMNEWMNERANLCRHGGLLGQICQFDIKTM